MVVLHSSKDFTLEYQVVRAYAKAQKVVEKTGIIADFSAKIVAIERKGDKIVRQRALMAVNDLNIRFNQEGVLYVGSQEREYVNDRGDSKQIYPVSMFPFRDANHREKTEQDIKDEDMFMDALLAECKEFIEKAQKVREERQNTPRVAPNRKGVSALLALAPKPKDKENDPAF